MHVQETIGGLRVTAPARLHLGFLDLGGGLGRRYGSIGLSVDEPVTEVVVTRADDFAAVGPDSERVIEVVKHAARQLKAAGRYRADVREAIPAHAGLGSGTQMALAIGAAIARLEGLDRPAADIADLAGRGARSAIGTAAFEAGGFIIDGGRGALDRPPPVLVRTEFPEDWRILLIFDPEAQGAHGDRETEAFAALPPFPEALAGELCRLVLLKLLPGLKETDIAAFGAALTSIQEIVGRHFAAAQGGSPWTSPAVGRLAKRLAAEGATGIGQTSWGPTGFAFVASEAAAARLFHSFNGEATAERLKLAIVRGRNTGARMDLP